MIHDDRLYGWNCRQPRLPVQGRNKQSGWSLKEICVLSRRCKTWPWWSQLVAITRFSLDWMSSGQCGLWPSQGSWSVLTTCSSKMARRRFTVTRFVSEGHPITLHAALTPRSFESMVDGDHKLMKHILRTLGWRFLITLGIFRLDDPGDWVCR